MLCEKCGRRQAEWGTLCNECEKKGADVDRQKDLIRDVNRLKWFALWMTGDITLIAVAAVVVCLTANALQWMGVLLLVLAAIVLAMSLWEWWLWRGYAVRLKNGEFRQVAEELLHHPKGFWKIEKRHTLLNIRRRRSGIGGVMLYFYELKDFHNAQIILEAFLKDE